MNSENCQEDFARFYGKVTSPKAVALADFRRSFPERLVWEGSADWRYRVIGAGPLTLLALPGGELVNDLGFEFALAISDCCRVVYPAYPRVTSMEELASGLRAVLDAEQIGQAAILGASFGGALAQVFVRRHPERISHLLLSNCGVPLRYLVPSLRLFDGIFRMLPWPVFSALLPRSMSEALDPAGRDRDFWNAYFGEMLSTRVTKADMLANFRIQLEYHRHYHFAPGDLEGWQGKVLIAESDTDVVSPRRRKALRETYPQAEVHTFHNGGHATMFLRFDEYLAMVKGFLSS